MGILKSVFKIPSLPLKQCCEQIALLDASFAHFYSTLGRGGRGEKHKIVQVAVFPIIFVTDCSSIVLDTDTKIKDLDQEETYKYLGIEECDGIQHGKMKYKIRKCYRQVSRNFPGIFYYHYSVVIQVQSSIFN